MSTNTKKPKITFSHIYSKLITWTGAIPRTVILLDVIPTHIEKLSEQFIEYDASYTDNWGEEHMYQLPRKGPMLILLFHSPQDSMLFTTIRTDIRNKKEYYRGLIGEEFDVIITEEP